MAMISMVIPTYSSSPELVSMALECAKSYRSQVKELIITEDSRNYNTELAEIADIYLVHDRLGMGPNINLGAKLSTQPYIAIVNSDTYLVEGNLEDLCIPELVTYPAVWQRNWGGPNGTFVVIPRPLYEMHGLYRHRWKTAEGDFFSRFPHGLVNTVSIWHPPANPGMSYRTITNAERMEDE